MKAANEDDRQQQVDHIKDMLAAGAAVAAAESKLYVHEISRGESGEGAMMRFEAQTLRVKRLAWAADVLGMQK